MYWGNFLHIYQPPTQKAFWIHKIAQESYSKVFAGLKQNKRAKVTVNINAVLAEFLIKYGYKDIIRDIYELAERGQLEFTASAKYHPFLPLIPENEIYRQIELNDITNKKIFGKTWKPRGFFPIEMAISKKVAKVVSDLGYEWMIMSEFAFPGTEPACLDQIYCHNDFKKLGIFFRNKDVSFSLLSAEVGVAIETADQMKHLFAGLFKQSGYIITALDGETFGHHRPGLEQLLFDLYKLKGLKPRTLSELYDQFDTRTCVEPRDSTWALLHADVKRKTPYSRWYAKDNPIQMKQWQLTNLALKLMKENPSQKKPRVLLDQALHSDQYWWASAQPWWSIEMIEAGAKDFTNTIHAFKGIDLKHKRRADKLYQEILEIAFEWQRGDIIAKRAKDADEDITQRVDKEKPYIPLPEFNRIVANLKKQMEISSKTLEFERAAQLRDRIKEWNDKKSEVTKKRK